MRFDRYGGTLYWLTTDHQVLRAAFALFDLCGRLWTASPPFPTLVTSALAIVLHESQQVKANQDEADSVKDHQNISLSATMCLAGRRG